MKTRKNRSDISIRSRDNDMEYAMLIGNDYSNNFSFLGHKLIFLRNRIVQFFVLHLKNSMFHVTKWKTRIARQKIVTNVIYEQNFYWCQWRYYQTCYVKPYILLTNWTYPTYIEFIKPGKFILYNLFPQYQLWHILTENL